MNALQKFIWNAECMVRPLILFAAIPVGAVLIMYGWSGCLSSRVLRICSDQRVIVLMRVLFPEPAPP